MHNEQARIARDKRRDILDLNLPSRLYVFMINHGIHSIGALTERSSQDLLQLVGFGPESLREVEQGLAKFGLTLKED